MVPLNLVAKVIRGAGSPQLEVSQWTGRSIQGKSNPKASVTHSRLQQANLAVLVTNPAFLTRLPSNSTPFDAAGTRKGGQITRSSQTSANHSLLLRDNASCVLGRALTMLFSYLRKLSLYHSPTHTRPLLTQDTMDGFVCGGESVYWLNSPSALGRSRCQRRGVVQLTDNLRNVSSSLLHLTFIFANPITACLIFGTSFEPLCFQMFWGPCRLYCTTSG